MCQVFTLHFKFHSQSYFLLLYLSIGLLKDVIQLLLLVNGFGYCSSNELYHYLFEFQHLFLSQHHPFMWNVLSQVRAHRLGFSFWVHTCFYSMDVFPLAMRRYFYALQVTKNLIRYCIVHHHQTEISVNLFLIRKLPSLCRETWTFPLDFNHQPVVFLFGN